MLETKLILSPVLNRSCMGEGFVRPARTRLFIYMQVSGQQASVTGAQCHGI